MYKAGRGQFFRRSFRSLKRSAFIQIALHEIILHHVHLATLPQQCIGYSWIVIQQNHSRMSRQCIPGVSQLEWQLLQIILAKSSRHLRISWCKMNWYRSVKRTGEHIVNDTQDQWYGVNIYLAFISQPASEDSVLFQSSRVPNLHSPIVRCRSKEGGICRDCNFVDSCFMFRHMHD